MLIKFFHDAEGMITGRQTGGDMSEQEDATVIDVPEEMRNIALGRFDELAEQYRIEDGQLVEVT